ncbi:hypothetical protein GCM10007940_12770 [Portibacter lacus]|uniref:Uncharacterized protein n=2 Tax=Portibacter lacus TaxID=1099794 RepID=A0AA37WE16_9BACT|nr:hypothetical protein GCM10007940_12770 [Portibacter lacus]
MGTFISCKSDKAGVTEISEENVEDLAEDFLEEELSMDEELLEVADEAGTVTNEVEVELDEVVVDKEKELAEKKAILKEQLKESPNLGKDCESIIKEYGTLVDKYLSGEDKESVIKKLAAWANDPIFNKCKKSAEYKDRFFDLEEKMYADEDEDL